MIDPKITVLMAVYNGGPFIQTAISCILAQTFTDFEFLIINDASCDDTLTKINAFQDKRIKVYSNKKNLGQTQSLNVGLQRACGKYIARLDVDDIPLPIWLEHQWAYCQKFPVATVVSAKAVVIDEQKRINKILQSATAYEEVILKSLVASPINHVGSFIKRDEILAIGGYDRTYKIAADYELWTKLIQKNKIIISNPEILIAIRHHAASLSQLERDKQDKEELLRIIPPHIEKLTGVKLNGEMAELLWLTIYRPERLPIGKIKEGAVLLRRIYSSFQGQGGIFPKLANKYVQILIKNLVGKRIISHIQTNNCSSIYEDIKALSPFLSGWWKWLLTVGQWLPLAVLKGILNWYNMLLRVRALCRIRRWGNSFLSEQRA